MTVFSVFSPRAARRPRHTGRTYRAARDRAVVLPVDELRGVTVVSVSGDLDAHIAPALVAQVTAIGAPAGGVVLDLGSVDFLGVAGVMALTRVATWADEAGLRLRVVASSAPVRRALEVTGFAADLVACSLDEAVDACSEVGTRPGVEAKAGYLS